MTRDVDFYFDYGSPASYVAYTQMPEIARRTGATVRCKPILLGGVFQATGNVSPATVPPKFKWMLDDLTFFAERYGVPFRLNPHFMINTLQLMRGAIYAQQEGVLKPYSDALYRATWADGLDTGNAEVVRDVLTKAGLDAAKLMAGAQDPAIKERLKAENELAVKRGIFGVPTMFVGDRMFFGQDRLPYVEEMLRA